MKPDALTTSLSQLKEDLWTKPITIKMTKDCVIALLGRWGLNFDHETKLMKPTLMQTLWLFTKSF